MEETVGSIKKINGLLNHRLFFFQMKWISMRSIFRKETVHDQRIHCSKKLFKRSFFHIFFVNYVCGQTSNSLQSLSHAYKKVLFSEYCFRILSVKYPNGISQPIPWRINELIGGVSFWLMRHGILVSQRGACSCVEVGELLVITGWGLWSGRSF